MTVSEMVIFQTLHLNVLNPHCPFAVTPFFKKSIHLHGHLAGAEGMIHISVVSVRFGSVSVSGN